MSHPLTAVLFDIDGTLLDMRGIGRLSFVRALESAFGLHDTLDYINFSGNTDLNVLQQVMAHHHRTLSEADCERFHRHFPKALAAASQNAELVLYPGVRALLEALSAESDILLGLVTGNIEACAWIKLQQFNLHNHFVLGAFGNEHADRNEIARLAYERVRARLNPGQTLKACFLIGDTPNDIRAAHSIGAVAVAVATGKHPVAQLTAAGAEIALQDLSDTASVMTLLRASH